MAQGGLICFARYARRFALRARGNPPVGKDQRLRCPRASRPTERENLVLILLGLGVLWMAVLLPPIIRHRNALGGPVLTLVAAGRGSVRFDPTRLRSVGVAAAAVGYAVLVTQRHQLEVEREALVIPFRSSGSMLGRLGASVAMRDEAVLSRRAN